MFSGNRMKPKTVFVVDNDVDTIESMKALLELEGFRVSCFERFDRCADELSRTKPCCTLMDYHMNSMHPEAFILHAKSTCPESPLFVLSGDHRVRDQVCRVGADAFLLKPYEPDQMIALLRKYC